MHGRRWLCSILAVLALTPGCGTASGDDDDADHDTGVDTPHDAVDTPGEGIDTPGEAVDTPGEGVDTPGETVDTPGEEATDTTDLDSDSSCAPGTGDCNGNPGDGCEADLTADTANCGRCGHDCVGGACTASACQPVAVAGPHTTSTGLHNGQLALDPTHIYYAYFGTPTGGVEMVGKDGTGATCIACDTGYPRDLVTDGTSVYWTDQGNNQLRKAPLGGGGTVTTLWSGQVGRVVAVDAAHVYWWDRAATDVMQAGLDGSGATSIATGQPEVGSLAVHSGSLFWTTSTTVMQLDLAGSTLTTLASGLGEPRSVAADATHVYWAQGPWAGTNTLQRIPRGGGTIELLATAETFAIAIDDTHVYVANNHGGTIWRIPKSGGAVEVLATGQPYPWDIELDDVAAYWSSEGDATIGKIAK